MGFNCGIVGMPNVGKSTLFNALTAANIAAENYPFCTIEPNVGVVAVPDERLHRLAEIVGPERVVPTTIEFVDIAGLVAGASRGEGLGNQFLAHIRETDAIAHIIRCFEDNDVVHVSGRVDPVSDIEVINTELALADLDTVERALEKSLNQSKAGDKKALTRARLLERVQAELDSGKPARDLGLDDVQNAFIDQMQLLTRKPVMYVANVSESGLDENPLLDQVRDYAANVDAGVVVVCAAIEAEIIELDEADRNEFLRDLGLSEPGLNRMIRAGYQLLKLLTFFTVNKREAHAWTVRQGATAVEAAARIHTDFARGFIRAEVTTIDDFLNCNGEHGAREAGKMRLEGKDYPVREGDVMRFRFNV